MKALKLSLLLCLGLFLSVGNLQAQAKKSCSQPCTKSKTAQVEKTAAAAIPSMVVHQTAEKTTKKCDPKNCDPKNCPPGCDISKCKTGKTAEAGMGNGAATAVKVGQASGERTGTKDKKNCSKKCMKKCASKTSAAVNKSTEKTNVLAIGNAVK